MCTYNRRVHNGNHPLTLIVKCYGIEVQGDSHMKHSSPHSLVTPPTLDEGSILICSIDQASTEIRKVIVANSRSLYAQILEQEIKNNLLILLRGRTSIEKEDIREVCRYLNRESTIAEKAIKALQSKRGPERGV